MIKASLILNILVLIPVCLALITDAEKMRKTAGIFTPARGILLAIYLTILLASTLLLFIPDVKMVFSLLCMQIVYKTLSPFTVKTIRNPIVISNLFIAAFHIVTVYTMIESGTLQLG
jgi:hypothetical protein